MRAHSSLDSLRSHLLAKRAEIAKAMEAFIGAEVILDADLKTKETVKAANEILLELNVKLLKINSALNALETVGALLADGRAKADGSQRADGVFRADGGIPRGPFTDLGHKEITLWLMDQTKEPLTIEDLMEGSRAGGKDLSQIKNPYAAYFTVVKRLVNEGYLRKVRHKGRIAVVKAEQETPRAGEP